jgi:hypothetical protein
MKRLLVLILLSLMLFNIYSLLEAQWPVDPKENKRVLRNALYPSIISDGFGGVIIIARTLVVYSYMVAQRVDNNGNILWGQHLDGVQVALRDPFDVTGSDDLLSDGDGGAYVFYNFFDFIRWIEEPGEYPRRESDCNVYVQHIDRNGARVWGDRGVAISTKTGDQIARGIVSDNEGGMIVIWSDSCTYAQRVSGSGELLWEEDGRFISNRIMEIVTIDGDGGAILFPESGIGGQRVSRSGGLLWNEENIEIHLERFREAIYDGNGSVILSGRVYEGTSLRIFAQKISIQGELLWGIDGIQISRETNHQTFKAKIATDNSNAAIFSWRELRGGVSNVFTQRVSSQGNRQWGEYGIQIGGGAEPSQVAIDSNEVMCIWIDRRNVKGDLYGQKLDSRGNRLWGADDVAISLRDKYPSEPQIISNSEMGAVVCWYEDGLERGTYIQSISTSGVPGGRKGDVNLDGTLGISDVMKTIILLLQFSYSPSEYESWAADYNNDEKIDVLDIVGIIRRIVG